jgi:hypothetical protein
MLPAAVADAIDLSRVRRALVIKLRHHGDVLLASPVFTVLRRAAPHAEIDALVRLAKAEPGRCSSVWCWGGLRYSGSCARW